MDIGRQTYFVSADAAREVFSWPDAVAAVRDAYAAPTDPAALPPRTVAKGLGAWLRTLPAIPASGRYFGAKLMGMAPKSATPGVDYVVVLYDRETSRLIAFVDAHHVTAYRTAATSAAALDRIAPPGPATLAILGSGLEAQNHLRAFASIRSLSEVTVFSPTAARREAFARDLGEELGVKIRPAATPQEAVRGADIVLAAARSHGEEPILYGDWLAETVTIVSIGSTVPEQREIDVSVVDAAGLIVCDTLEEVIGETGDMLAAAKAGLDVHGKTVALSDLMSDKLDDRLAAAKVRMFKSVGAGLQDVIVAGMIFDRALAAGLATPLPLAFDPKRPQK